MLDDSARAAATLFAAGQHHVANGANEAAYACFRQVTELQPSEVAGWQSALGMLAQLGRGADARSLAEAWFRATPNARDDIGRTMFAVGQALRRRGSLGDAAACFNHSRRIAPELASSQLPPWLPLTALWETAATDPVLGSVTQVLADRSQADLHLPVVQMLLNQHHSAVASLTDQPSDGSYAFYPLHAQVELTGYCQLRCPFCRTGADLRRDYPEVHRGLMTRETFLRIMEQVPSLAHLLLYNWGEPLLHKDLVWFLDAAKSLGKITEISSNMQFLPDAMAEGMVRAPLDFIRVSCDGTTQKAYEVYRKGGSLEKLLANADKLVDYKRKYDSPFPVIIFQMVVNRFNEHEVDGYEAFAKAHGADLIHLLGTSPVTPEGYRQMDAFEANDPRFKRFGYGDALSSCARPWTEVSFDWNGDVHLCCNPSGIAEYRMGNINEQAFDEIWNGMRYRYVRRLCTTQKVEDIGFNAPCHTCFRRFPTKEMAERDRWGQVVGPLKIGVD
jgi:MoaA/NifB/PqqE/SkfB family radical SAM enzyme